MAYQLQKKKEVIVLKGNNCKSTLMKEELKGMTFEHVSPDALLYGCGFRQHDKLKDSRVYIDLHNRYRDCGTPMDWVLKVYAKLKDYLTRTAPSDEQLKREIAGLDYYWPYMREVLSKQAGLTQIFLDYGCESRFVYPYVARKPSAMTLAISYGMAFDIAGDFRWVPLDDVACFHIVWEAICVGVRRRGTVEVDKALAVSARLNKEWDLALLGAGVLSPWYLQKGVPHEALKCRITAVDMDVQCIDWLPLIFGEDEVQKINGTHARIPRYNIDYYVENILEFCQAEENQKRFYGTHMMGVLSYYRRAPEKALALLGSAERVTLDEGYILLDLQLKTTQSERNSKTFWLDESLNQDVSVATAYEFMCAMCDQLGLVCTIVDYGNELEEPSNVVFCITKRGR